MSPPSVTEEGLTSSDPVYVREWLEKNHRKQLALLDKFLMELRLGRLSANGGEGVKQSTPLKSNRLFTALRTVDLLRHIVGSTRWKSAAQLLCLLRGLGKEMQAACGYREPALGNIFRRIMAAVREEAVRETESESNKEGRKPEAPSGGRLSLETMLWALPQHVRSKPSFGTQGDHQRQQSFGSVGDLEVEYPSTYYSQRPDLKQAIMEAMQEIINELQDLHGNINDQATSHIHSDEIILTYGQSETIAEFLKFAANKKRQFQVVVCEGAPHYGGHEMAKSLADSGIDTIVINDAAIFAMMARVNKVILPAHAVLANGGLVTSSGCNVVALAARHNSVPVVCVTGLYKLCPMYPHEGQDTLNDLVSPSTVIDLVEMRKPEMADVELVNPVHDYIKPEHVNLYVTNVGSFQPSFTYRLLGEYYHVDDFRL